MPNEQRIQKEFREAMETLAWNLDAIFNPDQRNKENGFVLLVFPFGCPPGARTNYISNVDGKDAIRVMKEFVNAAESGINDSEQVQ